MKKKEKELPLRLEVRQIELNTMKLKQRVILTEAILYYVLSLVLDNRSSFHMANPEEVKKLKDFIKLLKINRGMK